MAARLAASDAAPPYPTATAGRTLCVRLEKTTTFTAGLRHDGIAAPMVLDGPMNGEAFLAYVEQAIEAVGASLRYLPPYSPDFNPIEMAFAKLKALLRAAAARTIPDLWQAIADALRRFTPQECANYLAAAGYDAT